jgi:hypothetical protein
MRTFELIPLPEQNQKSFYGKAKVEIDDSGNETLYSYGTPIARKRSDGRTERIFDSWTSTTGKHIKAFLGLNKREFERLPQISK